MRPTVEQPKPITTRTAAAEVVLRSVEWLSYIESIAGDDEAAHGHEDNLHTAALEWIAERAGHHPREAALLARSVLLTSDIVFERWCA